ncbi:MAG: hypothetical protein DMG19_01355 [Acidobacteria bacterium]|nr:MAG: hypothetical protein DMG19_01355 [Acidobacteriota bacterium]
MNTREARTKCRRMPARRNLQNFWHSFSPRKGYRSPLPRNDIVTMTVFITDVRLGPEFLRIRKEILGRDFPASALIGVSRLMPVDGLLEIQAIAVLPCRDTATP